MFYRSGLKKKVFRETWKTFFEHGANFTRNSTLVAEEVDIIHKFGSSLVDSDEITS
jgi:hypothetical protein